MKPVLFIASLLIALAVSAQDTVYMHLYNAPGMDQAAKFIERSSGGFAVLGTTTSSSQGDDETDIYLLILDENLEIAFSRKLGYSYAVDRGVDLVELENGNLLVLGLTNLGGYNLYLAEVSSNGQDIVWQTATGNPGWDLPAAMEVDSSGKIWVAGQSYELDGQAWLCKLSHTGMILGQWYFGSEGNDRFTDVQMDANGDLLLAGVWAASGGRNSWAVRWNQIDELVWEFFGNSVEEEALSITFKAGNWILRGFREDASENRSILDYGLDGNGNLVWENYIEFGGRDYFISGAPMSGSSVLAAGGSTSFGAGGQDVYVWRQHESGYYESGTTAGGTGDEMAVDVLQVLNGEVYALATTTSFDSWQEDLLILHFPNDGLNPGPVQELIVHEDAFVVGVEDLERQAFSIYPNPARHHLQLMGTSALEFTGLKVFDLYGKEYPVELGLQGTMDIRHLPGGIYLLRLTPHEGDQPVSVRFIKD